MRRRIMIALVVAGTLATAFPATALGSPAAAALAAKGKWYNAGPCVPVAVIPDPSHPRYADISCVGSSVWTGTFDGVTDFTVTARINLLTNKTHGTLVEIFVGRLGQRAGTMTFHETFDIDGTTHRIRILAHRVSSSGRLAGAHADLVFVGLITPATNGLGTYSGTWSPT